MFGKNLRYLREKAGYKQSFLAERLRRSPSTISLWESGDAKPNTATTIDLGLLFNVTAEELMNVDLKKRDENGLEAKSKTKMIPMLGEIAAGVGIFAQENFEGYFEIDESVKADFCLKVRGDSMIEAGINYNDIAFFRKQPHVENGQIAAVQIQGEYDFEPRATLKKVTIQGDSIILSPANRQYDSKIFKLDSVKILGKLVATVHYYN